MLTPHHSFAVQVVQHRAEQLNTSLIIRFIGVVVQLTTELVSEERQEHVSTI